MDKATALRNAGVGSRGDTFSLESALRAALLGDGLATYAGNPNGNVTPTNVGEWCLDTTGLIFYRAVGTTNASWRESTTNNKDRVMLFDDFLGDVIADEWDTKLGALTSPAVAINVGLNGLLRMTTADNLAATTLANGGVQLQSSLNYQANQGGLTAEFKIKPITTTANFGIFVGLTDQVSALEMPITVTDGAATYTATADDAIGFFWNPAATTSVTTWAIGGVKATTATAPTFLTSAPAAATFETLRIDVSATGTAKFYRNDVLVGTIANAVTVTIPQTPVITLRPRSHAANTAQTLDVDYIKVAQLR